MLAYGRTELVAIDSYVKHGGLVLLPPRARYMGRLEWPCAACPIELAVIDGELVSIQEPLTWAGARAMIIDAALGAAHDHPDDVRCSVRSCACAPSHLHAPLTPCTCVAGRKRGVPAVRPGEAGEPPTCAHADAWILAGQVSGAVRGVRHRVEGRRQQHPTDVRGGPRAHEKGALRPPAAHAPST